MFFGMANVEGDGGVGESLAHPVPKARLAVHDEMDVFALRIESASLCAAKQRPLSR